MAGTIRLARAYQIELRSDVLASEPFPAKEVTNHAQEKQSDARRHQAVKKTVFAEREINDGTVRIKGEGPANFRQIGSWPARSKIDPDDERRTPEH